MDDIYISIFLICVCMIFMIGIAVKTKRTIHKKDEESDRLRNKLYEKEEELYALQKTLDETIAVLHSNTQNPDVPTENAHLLLEIQRLNSTITELSKFKYLYQKQAEAYNTLLARYNEVSARSTAPSLSPQMYAQEAAFYTMCSPYISIEEYFSRNRTARYDLALKRYKVRERDTVELGRDYERFIGYWYEMQGKCRVEYHGAIHGKKDDGIDLIIHAPGNKILLCQCKCRNRSIELHSKSIRELHGSVDSYRKNNPSSNQEITGVFITTAKLAPDAVTDAKRLGIIVREKIYSTPYPLVKCVAAENKKLYFLPFHPHYDSPGNGDITYIDSASAAEAAGFTQAPLLLNP